MKNKNQIFAECRKNHMITSWSFRENAICLRLERLNATHIPHHPTTLMALWDIECTLEDAQQTCTLQDGHDNCRILCRFLKHKGFCTQKAQKCWRYLKNFEATSGSAWLSWGWDHAPLLSGARGCTSPRAATLPNNGNYIYIKITNNINIVQYPLRKVS